MGFSGRLRFLSYVGGTIVFKAISSLGLGLFSVFFINKLVTQSINQAVDYLKVGLPSAVLQILGLAGMDVFLSTVLSAVLVVAYLRSLKVILSPLSS